MFGLKNKVSREIKSRFCLDSVPHPLLLVRIQVLFGIGSKHLDWIREQKCFEIREVRRQEVASEREARREMADWSIISDHGLRFEVNWCNMSERREMKLRIAGVAAGAAVSVVATVSVSKGREMKSVVNRRGVVISERLQAEESVEGERIRDEGPQVGPPQLRHVAAAGGGVESESSETRTALERALEGGRRSGNGEGAPGPTDSGEDEEVSNAREAAARAVTMDNGGSKAPKPQDVSNSTDSTYLVAGTGVGSGRDS